MKKVLVIAAHPDDEVLGVGGTIAKHSKNGDRVYIAIVTEGCSKQYRGDNQIIEQKKREARDAGRILGVNETDFFFLDLPDMELDQVAHYKINDALGKVINTIDPQIVYTHASTDLNKDHRMINESSFVACRWRKAPFAMYSYEVTSSSEVYPTFEPNHFVDITDFIDLKERAIGCYASELRAYPHPRSKEGVKIQAQFRGLSIQKPFAEGFKLIKSVE